jgi:hypothetical protein
VCHRYKGILPFVHFTLAPSRTSFLRLSTPLLLPLHRPSIDGPELRQYSGGEDHVDDRRCLLSCASDRSEVSFYSAEIYVTLFYPVLARYDDVLYRYITYSAYAAPASHRRHAPTIQEVVKPDLAYPKLHEKRALCFPPVRI